MLKIPKAGEPTPILVAAVRSLPTKVEPEPEVEALVRHRKRRRASESQDWETTRSNGGGAAPDRSAAKWWLLGGGGGLAVVVMVLVILMWGGRSDPPPPAAPSGAGIAVPPAPGESAPDAGVASLRSDAQFLKDAEPLAKRFMEAGTIEALLPLLRDPESAAPKLRAFYPGGSFKPFGFSKFNTAGTVESQGSIRTVAVANSEFEEKLLSFEESPSGISIDWESWVGWSEMPWHDFITTKPVAGKVFRVVMSAVDYYNFSFTDDRRWQSYRLLSPDGEISLYGYVKRGSELESSLRMPSDAKQVLLTLVLKYPEEPISPNQVIIESRVSDGWVIPNPNHARDSDLLRQGP